MSRRDEGLPTVRAATAGMLRGIALFLMSVAVVITILTVVGLALFAIEDDGAISGEPLWLIEVGVPTVAGIGGIGWLLWVAAARYDPPG